MKFGGFLDNNVIPRPINAGRALEEAGVQALGTAVEIELLECLDPVEDLELGQRLRARTNELGRVLEAYDAGRDMASILGRLREIRCQTVKTIRIRYRLRAFNSDRYSPEEQVPAVYQSGERILFLTQTDGVRPWATIARELAAALFPQEDPGRFAAGFKEVLAADSVSAAASTLDELGFAQLDTSVMEAKTAGGAVEMLGAGEPVEGGTGPAPSQVADPGRRTRGIDSRGRCERLLGANAPPPTPPVPDPGC